METSPKLATGGAGTIPPNKPDLKLGYGGESHDRSFNRYEDLAHHPGRSPKKPLDYGWGMPKNSSDTIGSVKPMRNEYAQRIVEPGQFDNNKTKLNKNKSKGY